MKTEVLLNQLEFNPFTMIRDDGFLISAARDGSVGLMTANWGTMGFLWNKPIVTVYVRPSRNTWAFLKDCDRFTLSFFPPEYSHVLEYCGSHSGREENKIAATGLKEQRIDDYVVYDGANLTFACRKVYCREMDERLIMDKAVGETYYKEKDVHWSFTGQIEHVYI